VRKAILLLFLALPASGQTPVTCVLQITYPSNNPQDIVFQVPDRHCNVAGMRQALAYLLSRMLD